ncbi:MAG TPA: methylmalonyl-CoA epimerase [Micromonosporaceae bacterium]|nr:methylmalonyl-CoA epimerase [Micromonosporaceae bacterium]
MERSSLSQDDADLVTGIELLGIDHVGVAVADLDAAVAFYEQVFGMRCVHRETNEEQGTYEAMMAVGHGSPGGGHLQLLAPLAPESVIGRFLDRRGPGIHQVAYQVADIEAASAALRARGVRLLYDEPRRGTAGTRVNFVHPKDAGGVLVELVEPAAASPPAGPPTHAGPPEPAR